MGQQDIDRAAALLATAYRYQAGIGELEDQLAPVITTIPEVLRQYVAGLALTAVINHVGGLPVTESPWDVDDPNRLRAALAVCWWECHNQYLTDYRNDTPTAG